MLGLSTPHLILHKGPITNTPISSRSKCILCLIRSPCTTILALLSPRHLRMFLLVLHQCLMVHPAIMSSTLSSSTSHSHLYPRLPLLVLQRLRRRVMGWCSTRLSRLFKLGIRTSTTTLKQLLRCLMDQQMVYQRVGRYTTILLHTRHTSRVSTTHSKLF